MSNIRKEGIAYIKKHFGEITSGDIRVSKCYLPEKSWTKSQVWWLEIPLKNLKENQDVHLICQKENDKDFHYLRVPIKELRDYIKREELDVRLRKNDEVISLHLSAQPNNLFQNLRGKGKIDFDKYLQKSKM